MSLPPDATITTYRNPVLPGWNAHPSVCNVPGKGYFVATSSGPFLPSIPVYHSTDLFTWELIGHAIHHFASATAESSSCSASSRSSSRSADSGNSIGSLSMASTSATSVTAGSRAYEDGLWTPSLRYFGGRWYVVVLHEDRGQSRLLLASTMDIFDDSAWDPPLELAQNGLNPDLFFDAGQAYLLFSDASRSYIARVDLATGKSTPAVTLYDNPSEGTRLLKAMGWYYLLIDSTEDKAACTRIYRSRTSPALGAFSGTTFESAPHNPVLCNGAHAEVRDTSRLNLVRGERGWTALFHGIRSGMDESYSPSPLGHETYMSSVAWVDGWPVVNAGLPIGLLGDAEGMRWLPEVSEWNDDFDDDQVSMAWYKMHARATPRNGSLILRSVGEVQGLLLLRQPGPEVDFEAEIEDAEDEAGVIIWNGGVKTCLGVMEGNVVFRHEGQEVVVPCAHRRLGIKARRDGYTFTARGDTELIMGHVPVSIGETGVHIGLYVRSEGKFANAKWRKV